MHRFVIPAFWGLLIAVSSTGTLHATAVGGLSERAETVHVAAVIPVAPVAGVSGAFSETAYQVHARLVPELRELQGDVVLTTRLATGTPLHELWFRLDANAFSSPTTTFAKEIAHRVAWDTLFPNRYLPGSITVSEIAACPVEGGDGTAGTDSESTSPSQGCTPLVGHLHETLLQVVLPSAVVPGQTLRVRLRFQLKVPAMRFSLGALDGNWTFVHWMPQLAGYSAKGWDAVPYRWPGEPSVTPATYHVHLEVPKGFRVAAGGESVGDGKQLDEGKPLDDGYVTYTFRLGQAGEFAWVADPAMVEKRLDADGVSVRALFHSEQAAATTLDLAQDVLNRFSQKFGSYPHKTLTLVESFSTAEPDAHPGVIILPRGSVAVIQLGAVRVYNPDVIRQIARQWWTDSPAGQLDQSHLAKPIREGLAEWATWWCLDQVNHGELVEYPVDWPMLPRPSERELQLVTYFLAVRAGLDIAASKVDGSRFDVAAYAVTSRIHPAVVFRMVEGVVGESTFSSAVRSVYEKALGRVTLDEFAAALTDSTRGAESSLDWSSFLRHWFLEPRTVDYAIRKVEWDGKEAHVSLERRGDGMVPVDVKVLFANGRTLQHRWDGRSGRVVLTFPERVQAVELDPYRMLPDLDRGNNRWPGPMWKIQLLADVPKPGERVASILPTIGPGGDGTTSLGMLVQVSEGLASDYVGVRSLDVSGNWSPASQEIGWGLSYRTPLSPPSDKLSPNERYEFIFASQGHQAWADTTAKASPSSEGIPPDRMKLSVGLRGVRAPYLAQPPVFQWSLTAWYTAKHEGSWAGAEMAYLHDSRLQPEKPVDGGYHYAKLRWGQPTHGGAAGTGSAVTSSGFLQGWGELRIYRRLAWKTTLATRVVAGFSSGVVPQREEFWLDGNAGGFRNTGANANHLAAVHSELRLPSPGWMAAEPIIFASAGWSWPVAWAEQHAQFHSEAGFGWRFPLRQLLVWDPGTLSAEVVFGRETRFQLYVGYPF